MKLHYLLFLFTAIACASPDSETMERKNKIEEQDKTPETESQLQRKRHSEELIGSHNIKINLQLPSIQDEAKTELRTPKEVAERVSVLAYTNLVAFGNLHPDSAIAILKKYNLWEKTTAKEKDFLQNPTEEKKVAETWKCEGIWTLLWALKVVPDMGFPKDLAKLDTIAAENYPARRNFDPNDFIKRFTEMRSKEEIMQAADLYYRLDWACVDARTNGKEIAAVNSAVVYERHYALNWLIRYMDQNWDDVTCDT
jgi:hypothetical protein